MRHLLLGATLAVAGLLPAQHVLAPRAVAHAPILIDARGIVLPAGDIPVAELIDAAARFLCRNFLYDFAAVENVPGFTLQRPLALDALGCEEVLYALLASRGFVVLPIDELRGLHEIAPLPPGRALPITSVPWRTPEEIVQRRHLRELVTTALVLTTLDAHQLANSLRVHFALQGMWQPGMPTASALGQQTLMLHGFRDQIADTLLAVQRLDQLAAASAVPTVPPSILQRLAALEQEVAALRAELARRR